MTVWINVTTGTAWRRPPVGVVRVETKLASELERLYPSGTFRKCVWDGSRFVEYREDIAPLQERAAPTAPSSRDPELVLPIVSRMQALKLIAQGALSLAPKRARPPLNWMLRIIKPRLMLLVSMVRRAPGRPHAPPIQAQNDFRRSMKEKAEIFNKGDTLISVGLDWEYLFPSKFAEMKRAGIFIVTCCYDLIPVKFPQYCVGDVASKFMAYFLDVAEGSNLILCISKQSETDLREMLFDTGGRLATTRVFTLGSDVPHGGSGAVESNIASLIDKPFILFVSTIERRKNHEVLYKAYHLLVRRGLRHALPKMVFVGMPGWGVSELLADIALDPLVDGLFVQLNHVTDADLRLLYERSLFCVYPSLYEGWGLPVGEALALGKAVIASSAGSIPEVGGDLVRYVDPWEPREWAAAILEFVTNHELRRTAENEIKARYKPTCWSEAAISVKRAIDELASCTEIKAKPNDKFPQAVTESF